MIILSVHSPWFHVGGEQNSFVFFSGHTDAPHHLLRHGDTFTYTLKLHLRGGAEAVGVQLSFYFDELAFAITQTNPGDLFGMTDQDITANNGSVNILWEAPPENAAGGSAVVFSATLRVLDDAIYGETLPHLTVLPGDVYGYDPAAKDFYDIFHNDGQDMLDAPYIIEPQTLSIQNEDALENEYTLGQSPDFSGLHLELYYNSEILPLMIDGKYAEIIPPDDWNIPGENKLIEIRFMGVSAYFSANMRYASPVVTAITILNLPFVTEYSVGEAFSAQGLSVEAALTDGIDTFSKIVGFGDAELFVTLPDLSAPGTKTVAVSYGGQSTEFPITVTEPPAPQDISSGIYLVTADRIGKIPVGTTVSAFLAGLNEKNHIRIYTGAEQVTSGIMKTGMTVKLIVNGEEIASKSAYVTGDVNGSGTVNITDLLLLNSYLLGKQQLSGAAFPAADLSGNEAVNITDLLMLNSYILGKTEMPLR